MSPEIAALLVLLAGAAAAVGFTLAIVFVVDRSAANARPPEEDDGTRERESENR